MIKNESSRYWKDPYSKEKSEDILLNDRLINLETREILEEPTVDWLSTKMNLS